MWILVLFIHFLLSVCSAQDPLRPYPLHTAYAGTSFLNHSSYLNGFDDPQWYLDKIPFVNFPDQSLQDVYYYRTSVIKRHLKYAHQGHGWSFTEFIQPVAWASKFQTIPDSAAHHMVEVRWLKNPQYVQDLIQLYTRAGVETQTGITYTHYVQDAIYEAAQSLGNPAFLQSQLQGMINTFYLWNVTVDNQIHLYHRTPLLDAQEYSLPGFIVGGPNGGPVQQWMSMDNDYSLIDLGPETYRPNFNAYMVAGARAIAAVAQMTDNTALSSTWNGYAANLYQSMQDMLWSDDLSFWIDVVEHSNLKVEGRELIGYFPFRFDVGTTDQYVRSLETGLNSAQFLTTFGPTTLEQTNPYFTALKNLTYCCLWQGQSWPFGTSVYLGTLARIARANRSSIITPSFFQQAMTTYTLTNYKDGMPFTAEAHYPVINAWSGDTNNHSEHYFHSTYLDNVFTNLVGIIPTLDDRLEIRPLVPDNWTYFLIEDLPYHSALFTLVWDPSGTHYNFDHSSGFSVYSQGTLRYNQATLIPFNLSLSPATLLATGRPSSYVNILANPNAPYGLPNVTADYTFSTNGDTQYDSAFKMINGLLWYDVIPDDFWTNNQSTTPYNTISITLPRARTFESISLAILDDTASGGVLACPYAIQIKDRNNVTIVSRTPWTSCTGNTLNTIGFDNGSTTTDFLNIIVFSSIYRAIGISEIQIWVPSNPGPRYEAEDGLLGTLFGSFEGRKSGMNATIEGGGVTLTGNASSSWVELADVRSGLGPSGAQAGMRNITIIGYGYGNAIVGMNFLSNQTVQFTGGSAIATQSVTLEVPFLLGGNVVTIFADGDRIWMDALSHGQEGQDKSRQWLADNQIKLSGYAERSTFKTTSPPCSAHLSAHGPGVTSDPRRLFLLKLNMAARLVTLPHESHLKSTATHLSSLASSIMELPSVEEPGHGKFATGEALAHAGSSGEGLGIASELHAGETIVDQSTLMQTISRRYSHPDIQHFLQLEPNDKIAKEAYTVTLRRLQRTLSPGELSQIQATLSVTDLHNVATKAQNLSGRGNGTGRIRSIVQTLNQYSGVLDIVSQSHPEYSALVWGSVKWLLLIAMNYINLTMRVADMLEEIGDNLPRFLLYQRLLPTIRMSQVISKLYAAIIEFLCCTIVYFHRRRIRRYFSMLWAPFEIRFKETMEKIQRLQICVENDARATAIVQQHAENTNFARQLSELRMTAKVTLQSVLDVKQRQSAILLMGIRQELFGDHHHHFVYQQEILDVYTTLVASDWQNYISEEVKHTRGYRHEWKGLTYVESETLQPTFTAGILTGIFKIPCQPPTSFLYWSPGMTQRTALACVVFQLLNRHAEKLLYRMDPFFYVEKFRQNSLSVDSLWQILSHIITTVSGIRYLFVIVSNDVEAKTFVRRLVEFGQSWIQTPCSLLVYNGADSTLSDTPGRVELDHKYDLPLDLDSCEALSKVVWMELGFHKNLSIGMRFSLWSNLWRTLRYNLMVVANEVVVKLVQSCSTLLSMSILLSEPQLKRKIISFLLFIPYEIPPGICECLRSSVRAAAGHEFNGLTQESDLVWCAEPLDARKRSACWAGVGHILAETASGLFEGRVLAKMNNLGDVNQRQSAGPTFPKSIDIMSVVEEIFAVNNWDTLSRDNAQQSIERGVARAAEFGLKYVLHSAKRVNSVLDDLDEGALAGEGMTTSPAAHLAL